MEPYVWLTIVVCGFVSFMAARTAHFLWTHSMFVRKTRHDWRSLLDTACMVFLGICTGLLAVVCALAVIAAVLWGVAPVLEAIPRPPG